MPPRLWDYFKLAKSINFNYRVNQDELYLLKVVICKSFLLENIRPLLKKAKDSE